MTLEGNEPDIRRCIEPCAEPTTWVLEEPEPRQRRFFYRTTSPNLRMRFRDVLHNSESIHRQRVWLVGCMRSHGYTVSEIVAHIHELNCWTNYDHDTTFKEVHSVIKSIKNPKLRELREND